MNMTFKRLIHGLSAAAIFTMTSSLGLSAHAQTIALDKVIAIVDDDVVMASQLDQRLGMVTAQLRAKNAQMPPEGVIRQQLIDQLIVESLQLQIGERVGMEISDAQLEQHISRIMKAENISRTQFEQQLAADGLSVSAFKAQLTREMIIDQVQRGSVNRRIKITDREVENFLKSKQGQFWSSPDFQLGHILIPATTQAEAAEAERKAQAIVSKLRQGADFRSTAVSESKGQNALQGGDLGWRKAAQLPPVFADALENMDKGDVSEPLRSGAGFHIIKVYDTRGAQQSVIQQAKVRHILIKPSAILDDDQARKKLAGIRQQIVDGADFSELAREHSEDTGSMLSGGDLGWSLPGKFVEEFERTMLATNTGAMSEPFRSQFGWHILKVDERREQDMSDTVRENQARRLLSSRRFDEERANWLLELRNKAYVEIK